MRVAVVHHDVLIGALDLRTVAERMDDALHRAIGRLMVVERNAVTGLADNWMREDSADLA